MEKKTDSVYRARIQKEIETLQAWEVFSSPSYLMLMKSLARELTDGRMDNVRLYCAPQEDRMGWCDGRQIGLNYGNGITESFLTLEQKNMSMAGIQGHECGHKNYSDFALREKYLEGFFAGIWYPYPPTPESEQEEAALEQMKGYLERRDEDALALIVQVASYLQNLLEDMYIEEKMCARFPGSVREGILLNRGRNLEWIPTLRELIAEGEDPVSILVNLCAQYALSGRINNWDNEQNELLYTFTELMPVIEKGCADEGKSGRFLATNQALLKIWKYLYQIIQAMEARKRDEEQEDERGEKPKGNGAEGKAGKEPSGSESRGGENEKPTSHSAPPEQESEGGDSPQKKDGNGAPDEISPAMQEFLKHLAERTPKFVNNEETVKAFEGFPDDVSWSGGKKTEPSEGKTTEPASAEKGRETAPGEENGKGEGQSCKEPRGIQIKLVDTDGPLRELLHQMAKERVEEQQNAEINRMLQLEMDGLDFDAGHKKVQKKVCREFPITEAQRKQYREYEEQVKAVQRKLASSILPILENQGARVERRLFMGRKVDMASIAHPQGAIYCKTYPGKKVEIAIAILLDMSESMKGARSRQAKLAALCLYEFCRRANIPVIVYGHHTDGYQHQNLEDETVYLHSCAEFEPDANDRYRIAALCPAGANRDGVAIRFVGQKLLRRTEKQKLLVLISDGFPNSNQYKGEKAKEDLCAVKKDLTGKGVAFLAAAIGTDKEKIQDIYRDSFLDISDMEKLPVVLTKQVLKFVRR